MPKQRQTCTRCSQRRQKCDRKAPCTRCVQNHEGHLCTTRWVNGYNPSVHRKYPRKSSLSPTVSPTASASDVSSCHPSSHAKGSLTSSTGPELTPTTPGPPEGPNGTDPSHEVSVWPVKLPDISIGALLEDKDTETHKSLFDRKFANAKCKGTPTDGANGTTNHASCYSNAARIAEIQYIQSILPPKEKMLLIVDYYNEYMMYWNGGIYHAPSFRKQLLQCYSHSSEFNLQGIDWTWMALLFAVLSSCIIGSSERVSTSWGYSIDDKVQLSRVWGGAAISCLNLGNYTSQYSIHSVQTVYIMHAYEHMAGSVNQWVALRSVALVIARGLGLDKIESHPDDERVADLDADQKQKYIDREISRRVWYTLVGQEWLCCASQSAYRLTIQPISYTTSPPRELDEETMMPVSDPCTPTKTCVGRYFFDYAVILLDIHNTMGEIPEEDEAARYAATLKFDGEMRVAGVERAPLCLSPRVPFRSGWPKWVMWGKRLHQASINHKLIMIHQRFLSKSFKDPRYTYSRWACVTASKNIVNLYNKRDPEEPQQWVEQSFIVTAGVCLILDLFHRAEFDPEAQECQAGVQKAIRYLQNFITSSVAVHGVRLLMSLLQEFEKMKETSAARAAQPMEATITKSYGYNAGDIPDISIPDDAQAPHGLPPVPEVPLSFGDSSMFNFDIDALGFQDLMEYMPSETQPTNNFYYDTVSSSTNWLAW